MYQSVGYVHHKNITRVMADVKTEEAKISIKVFVDKVKKRVVYAEADHSFVDILFSFMTLPLGTIVRILEKHTTDTKIRALGSLNNLYQSLQDFPESYFATEECKFMLLNPRSLSYDHCKNLKLKIDDDTEPIKHFRCGSCTYCSPFFSICDKAKCRTCGRLMKDDCFSVSKVCGGGGGGVFVSDIATFIVTDDFSVMPYSTTVIFRLLADLGVTDMSHLEERKLDMGSEQMLYLLKIALSPDSPFTHLIFHDNNPILAGLVVSGQHSTSDPSDLIKKATSASSKMVLEVSLQKSTGKLLFAEANEDFVDFLFGFLSIPLGTVIGTLLNGASSVTCMDNIFKSISNMSVGYLKSQDIKDMLLKPHFGQEYSSKNQLFPVKGAVRSLSIGFDTYSLKDPRLNERFIRQSGMFFMTDDLVITRSSSRLAINTLEKFKVTLNDVEKHEISIGLEEGLRMLKASLRSWSTLTSIIEHQLKN